MTESFVEHGADLSEFTMSKKHQSKQDEEPSVDAPKSASESVLVDSPEVVSKQGTISKEEAPPPDESNDRLKNDLVETKDRLLRLAAEFDNFKKIARREQQNSVNFANKDLILSLLPIIDNLEQAVLLGQKTDESKNEVLVGVEMVAKQLLDLLKKSGVQVFSAQGQSFDPARHEAMGYQENDSVDEGTVIVEYQKGYFLHDRLLRPARVVVSKKSGD